MSFIDKMCEPNIGTTKRKNIESLELVHIDTNKKLKISTIENI